jgi:hypothetical protein
MGITISQPAQGGGFSKDDHEGHLLMFIEIEKASGATQFGDATWAQCRWVVDLETYELSTDVAIHGKALAPSVYGPEQKVVVGRLVKGTAAREGQSPPWLLEGFTEDDATVANLWAEAYITELPSGRLVVDEEALRDAAATDGF